MSTQLISLMYCLLEMRLIKKMFTIILMIWLFIRSNIGVILMNDRKIIFKELKKLMNESTFNELKCRDCLKNVPDILVDLKIFDNISFETETPSYCGNSDLLIKVDGKDDHEQPEKIAYLWEIKSPQLPIFQTETKHRIRPTNHLYEAENQLINYYSNIINDETFRDRLKTSRYNVKFGGIIIGRRDKLVSNKHNMQDVKGNYNIYKAIRSEYFYKHNNIKLYNWDDILDQLSREIHEKKYIKSNISFNEKSLIDNLDISEHIEVSISNN